VITRYEYLTFGYHDVDISIGWLLRLAIVVVIWVKTVQVFIVVIWVKTVQVFIVAHLKLAVLQYNMLTREGNDTFYDIFLAESWHLLRVFEYNYLATLGLVLLVLQLCPGNGKSADDKPITCE